jgi:hypothetical protein
MSFWESELGEITGNASDAFAKSFTQIPDGTMALARIESFCNVSPKDGDNYILITWILTDGEFKGAKVEQKLKVFGDHLAKDPAKARHRALNMLKLIYQLYNTKPKHAGDPTDQDLHVFVGKTAGIRIRETEPNEKGRQYNWVAEIHEAKGFKCETGTSLVITHTVHGGASDGDRHDNAFRRQEVREKQQEAEDDIPF